MKRILGILLFLIGSASVFAQNGPISGFCNNGATQSLTSGLKSSNYLQGQIPMCTVSVYFTGTTQLAPIYKNASDTATVFGVTVTSGGTYSACPTVGFSGGGGTGATGTVSCIGTAVAFVTITNPGSGYTSAPTVSFTGGSGSGAQGISILSGTLTNPFTAAADASYIFYSQENQGVDIQLSGGVPPNVYVISKSITDVIPPNSTQGTAPTFETNGTFNTLQTLLNMENSITNAVGLSITPTNPSGGIERWEITGNNYTGNAATATHVAISGLTNATVANSVNNGNFSQAWGWASTSTTGGLELFEDSASLNNGTLLSVTTNSGSDWTPLLLGQGLTGSQTLPALWIVPTWNTSGVVDAGILMTVQDTFSPAGSLFLDFKDNTTSKFSVDKAGNTVGLGQGSFFGLMDTAVTGMSQCAVFNPEGLLSGTGAPCGGSTSVPLSGITAATANNAIGNGDFQQLWKWSGITSTGGLALTEQEPADVTGSLFSVSTLAASHWIPITASSTLNGNQTLPTLEVNPTWDTTGLVDAGILENVTDEASPSGSLLMDLQDNTNSKFKVDNTGSVTAAGFGTFNGLQDTGQVGSTQCAEFTTLGQLVGTGSACGSGGGGAVTQIIAGTNVTISPVGGTGAVTINSTGGGGGGGIIASGTATLGTSAIGSGNCATVVTVAASGVATTDTVSVGFLSDPTAIPGYGVSGTGAILSIYGYPTANNVNFKVCNNTANTISPGALTISWIVMQPSDQVAFGTATLGTASIASGACASTVTVSASGVSSTETLSIGFQGDPTALVGYGVNGAGSLVTVYAYPTTNNVNFKVCNSSANTISPGALTINWVVF